MDARNMPGMGDRKATLKALRRSGSTLTYSRRLPIAMPNLRRNLFGIFVVVLAFVLFWSLLLEMGYIVIGLWLLP